MREGILLRCIDLQWHFLLVLWLGIRAPKVSERFVDAFKLACDLEGFNDSHLFALLRIK